MAGPGVYVTYCVDTEGPLFESLEATFERVNSIYDLDLEADAETLARLQAETFDLGDRELEQAIARTVEPKNLDYNDSWEKIETMLDRLDSPEVRNAVPDSNGSGWRVNWHCLANYGYDPDKNPRRRDLGVHAVFDRYWNRYAGNPVGDAIHWHFHPVPRTGQANFCATAFFTNPVLFEIISRRVLERLWFPCVNRPGFHAERPDSHWFLEQWIPFDIANTNMDDDSGQRDLMGGRFGDWRRAPKDWVVYHPSHDDYQVPGACRRAIARCLYLGGRFIRITQDEVNRAFERARTEPVVMAFTNHDFRDVIPDIHEMQEMLTRAAARYPDVPWYFADAADAMRAALRLDDAPPANFSLAVTDAGEGRHDLDIRMDRPPFGPQPWLCYALDDGTVVHDNLDFSLEPNHWQYVFDEQTAPLEQVVRIGVAANTREGRTTVTVLDPRTGQTQTAHHN